LFQEEVLGSKENPPPKPDFGEYTYLSSLSDCKEVQGLRVGILTRNAEPILSIPYPLPQSLKSDWLCPMLPMDNPGLEAILCPGSTNPGFPFQIAYL
jgi:hypothetical protein